MKQLCGYYRALRRITRRHCCQIPWTRTAIYDLEANIDSYTVLDPDDIDKANDLLYSDNITSKDKQKLTFYFKKAKNLIENYDVTKQQEIVALMRHFVRFYEFLLQVSCFEDVDLHKKYNFIIFAFLHQHQASRRRL